MPRGRPRGAKDKKPRRPRGALEKCFKCPIEHEGWSRSIIRRRKGVYYCLEHVPPPPKKWPDCPECGDDDFGLFEWKGTAEKTIIRCEKCGFKDKAVNHFDAITVKVISSPVEEGVG